MSQVNQAGYLSASTYQTNQAYGNSKTDKTDKKDKTTKSEMTEGSNATQETQNTKLVKGMRTYGDAKLSDKALEYYKSLTKKYSNLSFVLVASDKKEQAQQNKASFATAGCLTVLVDTDKIERMANDENYRKQVESVIEKGASSMASLTSNMNQNSSNSTSSKVTAYGMSINNDGTASYFAVLSKATAAQKERIEKKAAQKKEDKKLQEKKADKKEAQEEALQRIKERKENNSISEDEVTITANSIEELMKKIQEYQLNERTNLVQTDEEKSVGQSFDCTI